VIDRSALTKSRIIVLGLVAAAVVYKLLNEIGEGTSSLMFIGLPAILAVIVAFAPPTESATGTVMKVLTLMMLIGAILAVEGAVCILMAAPIVYGIGWAVGSAIDYTRKRTQGPVLRVTLIAPIVLMSLQGVVPGTSGPRAVHATAERIVSMTPAQVQDALGRPVRFDRPLPAFFRYGRFPKPLSCELRDGRFVIDFEMGEPANHKMTIGSHAHQDMSSHLVLAVADSRPGHMTFVTESDTTMMSHWADVTSSTVDWAPTANGTRIVWKLELRRKLDPFWYFGPMQTYAASRTAEYLIDAVFR
jgi:hypothetical protein